MLRTAHLSSTRTVLSLPLVSLFGYTHLGFKMIHM